MTTKRPRRRRQADERAGVLTLLRAVLFMLAMLIVGVFAQSYTGRRVLVNDAREVCNTNQRNLVVPVANSIRIIQQADLKAAHATKSTAADRQIRNREQTALAEQLTRIGRYIDPVDAGALNPTDQQAVAALDRRLGVRAFSCIRAHPEPSPIDFFG